MARVPGLLILLLGCSELPLVSDTPTEGGSWQVSLQQAEYDQGQTLLQLEITSLADRPSEGLDVSLLASMPSMSHRSEPAPFAEISPSLYEGTVELDMPGLWELDGTVNDELFLLRISVN